MLRVENITYTAGSSVILRDIGFTLRDEDKAGLVGVNGAGKTTLMRIIAGKITPDQGKVSIDSVRIGYMPQTLKEMKLRDDLTVFEFLETGRPLPSLFEQQQNIYSSLGQASDKQLAKLLKKLEKLEAEIESWGGYEARAWLATRAADNLPPKTRNKLPALRTISPLPVSHHNRLATSAPNDAIRALK